MSRYPRKDMDWRDELSVFFVDEWMYVQDNDSLRKTSAPLFLWELETPTHYFYFFLNQSMAGQIVKASSSRM